MANSKLVKKTLLFNGISISFFLLLPIAKLFGWNIYVFDISSRPIQFMLLKKFHILKWITRITEHNSLPFYSTHSAAIDLANNMIDEEINGDSIRLAGKLCNSVETNLVFKRFLADHLRLLISINQYVINCKDCERPTLIISKKYSGIIKKNPQLLHPSIHIKYTFDWQKIRLKITWYKLTLGYFFHLLIQPLYKNFQIKEAYKYAISIPFPWAVKFKGAREFTFLVDDKIIKKNEVIFLVEYPEKREFYRHYSSLGYFLGDAHSVSSILDLIKPSTLKIESDFPNVVRLCLCPKGENFIYQALISLMSSRISWAIISKKYQFENYIYFNKEGPSQISANIFFKSTGIQSHAYSQFIGGCYQVCGDKSIFDNRNVHWSFLNPDYFYLNNNAMVDSMALHYQDNVRYINIGNIFSEKILEIKENLIHLEKIKKNHGINKLTKVITIFDTTYIQSQGVYSNYDEACCFLIDIIKLAKTFPNCTFLFKPSKSDAHFINKKRYWADEEGVNIVRLRYEFAKLSNSIMLNDFDDVIDLISVSDIVVTNSFSSPTTDALLANVPACWYQAKTDVSFSNYEKIPNLVIQGYSELIKHISNVIKNGYPANFLDNQEFNYLVGNKDKKALTDLRLNIRGFIKNNIKIN